MTNIAGVVLKSASWPFMIRLRKKGLTVWFVKSMVLILMQLVDNCVSNTMKRDRQSSRAVNPNDEEDL